MTTNLRKSLFPLTLLMTGAVCLSFFIVSCGGPKGDGVWIPIPKDTSQLGIRDHFIPKDSIAVYRKRFNEERDTLEKRMPSLFIPKSEAFNKPSVLELLKDSTCVGIKIYYGASPVDKYGKTQIRLILVGVDAQGRDLFVKKGSPIAAQSGDPGEGGFEYGHCDPPCYGPGN
jgi:hypothetical protein